MRVARKNPRLKAKLLPDYFNKSLESNQNINSHSVLSQNFSP